MGKTNIESRSSQSMTNNLIFHKVSVCPGPGLGRGQMVRPPDVDQQVIPPGAVVTADRALERPRPVVGPLVQRVPELRHRSRSSQVVLLK